MHVTQNYYKHVQGEPCLPQKISFVIQAKYFKISSTFSVRKEITIRISTVAAEGR